MQRESERRDRQADTRQTEAHRKVGGKICCAARAPFARGLWAKMVRFGEPSGKCGPTNPWRAWVRGRRAHSASARARPVRVRTDAPPPLPVMATSPEGFSSGHFGPGVSDVRARAHAGVASAAGAAAAQWQWQWHPTTTTTTTQR